MVMNNTQRFCFAFIFQCYPLNDESLRQVSITANTGVTTLHRKHLFCCTCKVIIILEYFSTIFLKNFQTGDRH